MPIDIEFKDKYNKIKESTVIRIRLNAKEQALLDSMMRDENWGNRNLFIKRKLFGKNVMQQTHRLIQYGNEFDMQNIIRLEMRELAKGVEYIGAVYNKTIDSLSAKQADVPKYIAATKETHRKALKRTEEIMDTLKLVSRRIGLDLSSADTGEDYEPDMKEFSIDEEEIIADRDPMENMSDPF